MKQLLLAVAALLVISGSVSAQESYTVNASATNVVRVERERVRWNTFVCTRFALAASCTQAQACVAAGVTGGASCTVANARAADVEIFSNNLAGRDAFFSFQLLLKLVLPVLKANDVSSDHSSQQTNWTNGSTAVKDAMCAAAGAPVPATTALGCNLYP